MKKPYSQDLRDRVLDAVLSGRMTRRQAARHYAVSPSSAIKWVQAYEREGRRSPTGKRGHRPLKLACEREWLLAQIEETADLTLEALSRRLFEQRQVKANIAMLSRFFRREGISFKKKHCSQVNRTERILRTGVSSGRNTRAGLIPHALSSLTKVFSLEQGAKTNMTPTHGWS